MCLREDYDGVMSKKPEWVIEKEQKKRADNRVWLFGLHAVRDALSNPHRIKRELLVTKNAHHKLQDVIGDTKVEIFDPHKFHPPIDRNSVHQGAVLEVEPLNWGSVEDFAPNGSDDLLVLLDRVTDPHNVGAILRSAEVFGARAVFAPHRHSAPETGALAKTASGALERQPYIRVGNLGNLMEELKFMGYALLGLDGEAETPLAEALKQQRGPMALVMGAEGPGLRQRTKDLCDELVKIPFAADFGSLNVSNAAAVSLYAARQSITARQ